MPVCRTRAARRSAERMPASGSIASPGSGTRSRRPAPGCRPEGRRRPAPDARLRCRRPRRRRSCDPSTSTRDDRPVDTVQRDRCLDTACEHLVEVERPAERLDDPGAQRVLATFVTVVVSSSRARPSARRSRAALVETVGSEARSRRRASTSMRADDRWTRLPLRQTAARSLRQRRVRTLCERCRVVVEQRHDAGDRDEPASPTGRCEQRVRAQQLLMLARRKPTPCIDGEPSSSLTESILRRLGHLRGRVRPLLEWRRRARPTAVRRARSDIVSDSTSSDARPACGAPRRCRRRGARPAAASYGGSSMPLGPRSEPSRLQRAPAFLPPCLERVTRVRRGSRAA